MSTSIEPKSRDYDSRLEAVIVCNNYSDFLSHTLPFSLSQLDRIVVVTSFEDQATQDVCNYWSVECIKTDVIKRDGPFCKGAAINRGLMALRQRGWILQLDADIVLPLSFRNMLFKSGLQEDCLYGAERCEVTSYEEWLEVRDALVTTPQFRYRYLVSTWDLPPVGSNVVHKEFGFTPIGYLQMAHSSYLHRHSLRYPDTEGSAECEDVQFALNWPREKRIMLPTVRVVHLDSTCSDMGANWNGRTTPRFGPYEPMAAEAAYEYAPSPTAFSRPE